MDRQTQRLIVDFDVTAWEKLCELVTVSYQAPARIAQDAFAKTAGKTRNRQATFIELKWLPLDDLPGWGRRDTASSTANISTKEEVGRRLDDKPIDLSEIPF